MTFKRALTFLFGLEISTVFLITGLALLCVLLGLNCIWVVAFALFGLNVRAILECFSRMSVVISRIKPTAAASALMCTYLQPPKPELKRSRNFLG